MKVQIRSLIIGLLAFAPLSALAEVAVEANLVPVVVSSVAPIVPREYAERSVSGKVTVSFRINELGEAQQIRVENATHSEYAASVMNALRLWRFEPAAGSVASTRYVLPVVFN